MKNNLKDKSKAGAISKALASFAEIQVELSLSIPLNYLFYIIASGASDTQTACSVQSNQAALLLLAQLKEQNFKVGKLTKEKIDSMIDFLSITAIQTEKYNLEEAQKRDKARKNRKQ